MTELTKLYPMVQIKKNTWEIDEFDCASIFLLIGTEKAMVIDCGMGIGDLRGAIEMITDKPLICVISHGHIDHTANARQFGEIWLNPKDQGIEIPMNYARRRYDTEHIAQRQKGSIGAPYNMYRLYAYDIEVDLREPGPDEPMPVIHDLTDGMQFDLGGRTVTAYECPGHTAGEMVFIDDQTHLMFAGDALNFNLGIGAVPVETTLKALRRLQAMQDQYTGIFNGHHDFRPLGMPLDDDCLPTVISMCEDIVAGHYSACTVPSFWGQPMPLSASDKSDFLPKDAPPMNANKPQPPRKRVTYRKGRNFLGFNPNLIQEE